MKSSSLVNELKDAFSLALDWAFPGTCLSCGVLLPRSDQMEISHPLLKGLLNIICPVCAARTQRILPTCPCQKGISRYHEEEAREPHTNSCGVCSPFETFPKTILSAVHFSNPFDQIVYHLKYGRGEFVGNLLGELMVQLKGDELEKMADYHKLDGVIPVPLTRWRQLNRGYNQSLLIAQPIAEHLNLPLLKDALTRRRFRMPQARLEDPAQRFENVKNAFQGNVEGMFERKRFLLVDDVITTGATLSAATDALMKSGAVSVCAATVCSASAGFLREYLFTERCAEEMRFREV